MSRVRHAFTLIEVLISIVVLSLGLLGLAAVFPTVVKQQVLAVDAEQARSLEDTVEKLIRWDSRLNDADEPVSNGYGDAYFADLSKRRGWRRLVSDPGWSTNNRWEPVRLATSYAGAAGLGTGSTIIERDAATAGDLVVGDPQFDPDTLRYEGGLVIPVRDRLLPRGLEGQDRPQFVWDVVLRRVDAGMSHAAINRQISFPNETFDDDAVEVAVFVRRIDTNIRVPGVDRPNSIATAPEAVRRVSLFDVLTGNLPGGALEAFRRVPVGADQQDFPSYDGGGRARRYSRVVACAWEGGVVVGDRVEYLQLVQASGGGQGGTNSFPTTGMVPYASQVGQRLVDQGGQVYRVVPLADEVPDARIVASDGWVRISPGMSVSRFNRGNPAERQLIFTPQVPVGVRVFRVEPWRVPSWDRRTN